MPVTDLNFLREDLRRQRQIAEQALEEAKRINSALEATSDRAAREGLEKAKAALIDIARGLAANATSTSTAATVTVLGVGGIRK